MERSFIFFAVRNKKKKKKIKNKKKEKRPFDPIDSQHFHQRCVQR
ncbi:Uncharacterized protein APZ42_019434 [Daphnia magna]|uniref:Uncharacterized protein n=1 Tax=Daphnia magna TaxID=35525 RepID=A0A162CEN2_9CRUS|nr:Uncharacterized protein APZ42_019434 [Daphnia magna]